MGEDVGAGLCIELRHARFPSLHRCLRCLCEGKLLYPTALGRLTRAALTFCLAFSVAIECYWPGPTA